MFKDLPEWRTYVIANWDDLHRQVEQLELASYYENLLGIAFLPALPKTPEDLDAFLKLITGERYTEPLIDRLKLLYDSVAFSEISLDYAVRYIVSQALSRPAELRGVERLLLGTGSLAGSQQSAQIDKIDFIDKILAYFRETIRDASAIRVQAEMIHAGQNVIIAGHDVNVVSTYFSGSIAKLKTYLGLIRAELNQPDLERISSAHSKQANGSARLHQIYTGVDVWGDVIYTETDPEKLAQVRYSIIEKDKNTIRIPVLEAVASKPLLVITGSAGTGKTMLARYIAISLSYACDPETESKDDVKGLDLLGPAWIHGVLLPLYVNLRSFADDKETFPQNPRVAQSTNLLKYLRKKTDSLAPDLESYLTNTDVPLHGAFLILDGYDEVYNEQDRFSLKVIIDQWIEQFPKCRVLVTSRTYAYRDNARWKLSDRFVSAELAPYTWQQIQSYITNWYNLSAILRPGSFGGSDDAEARAQSYARDLLQAIVANQVLYQLARQPLLLALLTLIHEAKRKLPDGIAELFDETVNLLNSWNPPLPGEPLSKELADLKLDLVRNALQLLAFDLQRERSIKQNYPSTIGQEDLVKFLKLQEKLSGGLNSLGASVDLVLEYLESRNGILISDVEGTHRFPHLSIQEYLAACALIEQYDEIEMPKHLIPEDQIDGWTFPENVAALVLDDPDRWREVGLLAGSILSKGRDKDRRWDLIQALLPQSETTLADYRKDPSVLSENSLYAIYMATEIWVEVKLKPRQVAHRAICKHLIDCLETIRFDERLPEAERAKAVTTLGRLVMDI